MRAITITSQGIISNIPVAENGQPLYELVRKIVEGYMENVYPRRLRNGYVMVVNEEGLLKGLPINPIGSYLYETDKHGYPIVGNVIILKLGTYCGERDIVGLSEDEANTIMKDLLKILPKI